MNDLDFPMIIWIDNKSEPPSWKDIWLTLLIITGFFILAAVLL